MMLTIHGLPISTKYHDLKVLVKQECNISDFILDNLISESDGTKKVRIGLHDERQGSYLMKCLNGYRMSGHMLRVLPAGKQPDDQQQNFDQKNSFPPRNNFPNQPGPDYNRPMAPGTNRLEPWGPSSASTQWAPTQQPGPNQPHVQSNYNYQQGPGSQPPYGQQHPAQQPRPETRFDQRYQGYPPKAGIPEAAQRRGDARSHVLRSVEIIDEPMDRPIAQPDRYAPAPYAPTHKSMTIMKDNFQGPQYNLDRPSVQHPGPYQGHPGQAHHPPAPGHSQSSSWDQTVPPQKQPFTDRKYPEPEKRPILPKPTDERNIHDYNKLYDKAGHGPRFSPRRDVPKGGAGPRFSPRRDIPKDGPRFSPRRDIPKDAPRFSPRRDIPKNVPRFSPRRDIPKDVPRFSPRRDIPKDIPRFSPRRDIPKDVPRFSPRRELPKGGLPRFSPRRDAAKVPRFSPRDIPKDAPGPRFSPRRDILKDGPRFSPRQDIPKDVPRFSPRRDMPKDIPRFSPRRDIPKDVPRFSPRRDIPKDVPRFSPRRDIPKDVPRFSPRRDIPKDVPRFSPRRDIPKDGHGPRFSPRRDVPKDIPRFSPRRDIKDVPRFSPRRDIPKDGPRFSPKRHMFKHAPRFSPRRDDQKDALGPRFSPRREKDGPRFSPRRDIPKEGPGPRFSPRRDVGHGRRDSPSGRRMPSPARRISPGRRVSPSHVLSSMRRDSPGPKRASPGRYSPTRRHHDKPGAPGAPRSAKDVRPAYEPPAQAPNQAMYSGAYRAINENVQYAIPGLRPQDRPTWQQDREKPVFAAVPKKDEERRERVSRFAPIDPERKRSRSPHKSRSPIRRDRSPPHDRYKKGSSPPSPRRSWALEKRRSPNLHDAPPPPVWPGRDKDGMPIRKRPFPDRGDEAELNRAPLWERPSYDEKNDHRRSDVEERFPNETIRVRTDLGSPHTSRREPSPRGFPKFGPRQHEPKFEPNQLEPKFEPRQLEPKFEPRREPKFEPRQEFHRSEERGFDRAEFRPDREGRQDPSRDRKEEYPRHDDRKGIPKDLHDSFDKDFEDIYKRAVDLNKRAQQLRKNDRQREEYSEDRNRHEDKDYDQPKSREGRREEFSKRDPEWTTDEGQVVKAKREKAVEEISRRIMKKHGSFLQSDLKRRVLEELKMSLSRIVKDLCGVEEVSFMLMMTEFDAKFDAKDEAKMFNDVMTSLPSHFRQTKRPAEEPAKPEIPAKSSRRSHDSNLKEGVSRIEKSAPHVPEWSLNIQPPNLSLIPLPQFEMVPQIHVMPPLMVPPPSFFEEPRSPQVYTESDGVYQLYLCKDDFDPYNGNQADYLKKFLVSQLIKESQTSQGWAPDFTIKGLQSLHRYELVTKDEQTRDWIVNLDFSEFGLFNVLVYTKEELWYERAAVWLPGHSKCRNIEPLVKLRLQNRKLVGVNIGKWKLVKKIVMLKGTRIYVDMPPSSARSLEKYKMMLSYELQKVNVYLKAVAVDKDAFDFGLKENSIQDPAEIITAIQNSPMPSLTPDSNVIKITLKGNKTLSLAQARKIKEMVIYQIFKHHQDCDTGKTDFLKYGFCTPGHFGVVAENSESKHWLTSVNIGKLNRHPVVVLGSEVNSARSINVTIYIKNVTYQNMALIMEKLKQSQAGVKGLNFHLWKAIDIRSDRHTTGVRFEVEMDLESIETICKMNCKLDYYVNKNEIITAQVTYEQSSAKLSDVLKKHKAEMNDSYIVANMDLASSDDDESIVFMGEVTV